MSSWPISSISGDLIPKRGCRFSTYHPLFSWIVDHYEISAKISIKIITAIVVMSTLMSTLTSILSFFKSLPPRGRPPHINPTFGLLTSEICFLSFWVIRYLTNPLNSLGARTSLFLWSCLIYEMISSAIRRDIHRIMSVMGTSQSRI